MENISEPTPLTSRSEMPPSGLGNGFLSPLTLGLVSCSGVGAFLFTGTYLIEGITRAGYNAWQQPISALSLGPGGWVQQVNFVVFGVLTLLSVFGWYQLLTPGRASIGFPLFQSVSGLSLIGAGFFSLDPNPGYPPDAVLTAPTLHGTLHVVFAYVIILSLACGCFALARRFAIEPRWRGWAVYSVISGVLILVFFALFLYTGLNPGFVERLSAGSHALWSFLLVATLFFQKRQGKDNKTKTRVVAHHQSTD